MSVNFSQQNPHVLFWYYSNNPVSSYPNLGSMGEAGVGEGIYDAPKVARLNFPQETKSQPKMQHFIY